MKEQMTEINQLIKKYRIEIDDLEKQLQKKKNKMSVLYEAMKLLEQERILQPTLSLSSADPSQSIIESLSDKYKNMSLNNSILDILSDKDAFLNGQEIFDELMKNGYTSGSSNIKRDVYISLYRLNKEGKVTMKISENRKKYLMPLAQKVIDLTDGVNKKDKD